MATLEIRRLTKRYNGIPAVNDVSFSLRSGEVLGYIGPNGAGKSTTVKMMIGLGEPSEGQIIFNGRSIIVTCRHFSAKLAMFPKSQICIRSFPGASTCNLPADYVVSRLRSSNQK